jgi:hypothetical protein
MENNFNVLVNNNKTIEYFVLIGLPSEVVRATSSFDELESLKPEILAYFPNVNEMGQVLKNTNSLIMTQIIFPLKSDFINSIEDFDEPDLKIPPFKGYVKKTNAKPKEFYHSFSYIYDTNSEYLFPWHYGILIFWEEFILNGEVYFIAKAMVVISKQPYYVLFKYILEDLYKKFYDDVTYSLEIPIINSYFNLAFENKRTAFNSKILNLLNNKEYFIDKDTIIPVYDLNLGAFFSRFTIKDLLLIAEQFLKRHPILIFSTNISVLHPTYFTIISLLYPLNITNVSDYYKFLVPATFGSLIYSAFACFIAFYCNLDEEKVFSIVKAKQMNTLVIDIDKEVIVRYDYSDDGGDIIKQEASDLKSNLLLDKLVCDDNLIALLDGSIDSLVKPEDNCYYSVARYVNYNSSCNIRKQLFTYFTKILTAHFPSIKMEIREDASIDLQYNQEEFLQSIEDEQIRHFYSEFITTPSFDGIIHKSNDNDPNLNKFIILEELIKIITNDKNRIYFDSCFNFSEIEYVEGLKIKAKKNGVTDNPENFEKIEVFENKLNIELNSLDHIFDSFMLLIEKFLILNFDKYKYYLNNLIIPNLSFEDFQKTIFTEIETFVYLVETDIILLNNLEETTNIIYILILCIEILSNEDENFQADKFKSVFEIFLKSSDFIIKYSFIISLIYEVIIKVNILSEKYEMEYLNKLAEFKLQPTFDIYIKSNKKGKKQSTSLLPDYINPSVKNIFPEKSVLKFQNITCINDHEIALTALITQIKLFNNKSLKCLICNEDNCLFLYSNVLLSDFEDRIIHPSVILIKLLKEVLRNNSFRFMDLYKFNIDLGEELRVFLAFMFASGLDFYYF